MNWKLKCFNIFSCIINRNRNSSDLTGTSNGSIHNETQNNIVLTEMNKYPINDLENIYEKLGHIDLKTNENLNKINTLNQFIYVEIHKIELLYGQLASLDNRLEYKLGIIEEKIDKLNNHNFISEELVIINKLHT
jgi:hypothetical protein